MKSLILCFFLALQILSLEAGAVTPLKGSWKFTEVIYRGEVMPRPNPKLNLIWTFFENGSERLYWDRTGETGFCERFATYQVVDDQIKESIFAVNPLNAFECSKDLDMQVGRSTSTKIKIEKDQILLYFQVGDEELIYILKEEL